MGESKNKTRYAVLGMLSFEAKSGYDIKKDIESHLSVFWNESYGQIYRVLKQLEKEKLVIKKHLSQKRRPSKDVYSITDKGLMVLRQYLSEPPDKLVVRDELMLKFVLGHNVSSGKNIKLLEHEIKTLEKKLSEVNDQIKNYPELFKDKNENVNLSMMIKLGIQFYKTKIKWCKEAVAHFREIEKSGLDS